MLSDEVLAKIVNGEELEEQEVQPEVEQKVVEEVVSTLPPVDVRSPELKFPVTTRKNKRGKVFNYGAGVNDFLSNR